MDVYTQNHRLQILSQEIKFEREFKSYSTFPKLFALANAPLGYKEIRDKLLKISISSHDFFEYPQLLWKNEEFFVGPPFKLNEDINSTKVIHPKMSPSNRVAAFEEFQKLLKQELIEPTKSDWTCRAFYVNKRSEQVRGKKRLVIDYCLLNQFLKDDKFPLPKIYSIYSYTRNAHIFSKFDLKSGF